MVTPESHHFFDSEATDIIRFYFVFRFKNQFCVLALVPISKLLVEIWEYLHYIINRKLLEMAPFSVVLC